MSKITQKIKTLFTKKPKILFLVKKSQKAFSYSHNSSGLFNSANFVCQMLKENGIDAKIVEVIDGNYIDREIHKFKPDTVIFEAFWVSPSKMEEIKKLHHHIKFIVRNHSKPEFLAQEGIAFEWSLEYFKLGIKIACNSHEMIDAYKVLLKTNNLYHNLVFYLPNYYFNELEHQ